MRGSFSLLLLVLFPLTPLIAQDEPMNSAEPESYILQLTEFRLASASDPKLTPSEIVDRFVSGDEGVTPVSTVRMSALSDIKCMAQFGRQTAVTTGSMTTGRGTTQRATQMIQVGTMVRFTASPRAGKVLVELSYESSQLEGEGTDSSPPDTVTSQFETAALVEFGKPKLIGGTSEGQTSFLILSVNR